MGRVALGFGGVLSGAERYRRERGMEPVDMSAF